MPGAPTTLTMLWWRSTDGGRSWSKLASSALPFQGRSLGGLSAYTNCPGVASPHLTFATAEIGWFSEGDCATGNAHPEVWWTTDAGAHWSPAYLPPPASGWGDWARTDEGGVDVGAPRYFGPPSSATVLVPVALGKSSLVVERSTNGGRTWAIASQLELGLTPQVATSAEWFEALSPSQWLVPTPTEVFSTSDAGEHWAVTRSALDIQPPAYFSSLNRGFAQGTGFTMVWATADGGRDWAPEPLPASLEGAVAAQMREPVSIIDSAGPGSLLAAGSAGLYFSSDGGRTWVQRLGPEYPVGRLDVVSSEVVFALAGGELLRSTDGGSTWSALLQPPGAPAEGIEFWSPEAGIAETAGPYYVTHDGGSHWSVLVLPDGWQAGPTNGDGSPGAFCFSEGGTGWAAASHGGDLAVVVTTDGGRHWTVALAPRDLPGSAPKKQGGSELLGADVSMAGCRGKQAWVLVAQPAALGNMPDVPYTFDILVTRDLGRTWEDVFQAGGSSIAKRPRVPSPPGGPVKAIKVFPYWAPESAITPAPSVLWLTSYDPNFGGEAFASTGDNGQQWAQSDVPGQVARPGEPLPNYGWLATTASSTADAWVLFSGPQSKQGLATSVLYMTNDGGATWTRATTLSWP